MMTSPAHRLRTVVGLTFVNVLQALGPWLACGLAAAVGALLFFAWLADEVLEGATQAFDESVRTFVNGHASPALTSVMRMATVLGSVGWLATLGVGVAIYFVLVGWRRAAALFAMTMAGAAVLNAALKVSFGRARPAAFFETPSPSSYSFPSGHALFSLCFYGALAAIVTARLRRPAARAVVWATASTLVALIGFSRVYLGLHYPSDVLAGYAAAIVWVVVVAFGDFVVRRRGRRARGRA
jgi:undecaprenyl-diphosphatase